MAVENALGVDTYGVPGRHHAPPNEITRLMRNIILGAEFVMSHITHFYALAAISYVQGPNMPPWIPYFDNSYYNQALMRPGAGSGAIYDVIYHGESRDVPLAARQNITGSNYTGLDGIWDNVIYDYVVALKYRRDAANASAILGGRTPMIQNGCLVGGCAHKPTAADLDKVKSLINGCLAFVRDHQIPLAQILSYLYPTYNNNNTNAVSGYGSGAVGEGANRALAWGVFDLDGIGGDDPNRLLKRGCFESDGANGVTEVLAASGLWASLKEDITNSKYENYGANNHPLHPSSGYTNPASGAGYSWAKSPRIDDGGTLKACQVGPLARMAVHGERGALGAGGTDKNSATGECYSYKIGSTKTQRVADHPYLGPILAANLVTVQAVFGPLPAQLLCGFSTMDRHRARAYEAAKIAHAIVDDDGTGQGWCDRLKNYLSANPTAAAYTTWSMPSTSSGVKPGYGAHEAPRGALAHFIEVSNGRISNYQAVVPTTWNVNPKDGNGTHGPIESAVIGTTLSGQTSGGNIVAVEALRVVQGFDPCIACTVH